MGRELNKSPVRPIVFVKKLILTRRTRRREEHTSTATCSCRCVGSATAGEEHANTRALVALSGADRDRENLEGHSREDRRCVS